MEHCSDKSPGAPMPRANCIDFCFDWNYAICYVFGNPITIFNSNASIISIHYHLKDLSIGLNRDNVTMEKKKKNGIVLTDYNRIRADVFMALIEQRINRSFHLQ